MPRYDKNINTSKTQNVPDSTITRKFPISIKLLKNQKSAKNDTVSDDPKDENKSHERNIHITSEGSSITNAALTDPSNNRLEQDKDGSVELSMDHNTSPNGTSTISPLNILTPPEDKRSQERSASPLSVASSQSSKDQRPYSPRCKS